MKNTKKIPQMRENLKDKVADRFSSFLINQAEMGIKFSSILLISEPVIPVELIMDEMNNMSDSDNK